MKFLKEVMYGHMVLEYLFLFKTHYARSVIIFKINIQQKILNITFLTKKKLVQIIYKNPQFFK